MMGFGYSNIKLRIHYRTHYEILGRNVRLQGTRWPPQPCSLYLNQRYKGWRQSNHQIINQWPLFFSRLVEEMRTVLSSFIYVYISSPPPVSLTSKWST